MGKGLHMKLQGRDQTNELQENVTFLNAVGVDIWVRGASDWMHRGAEYTNIPLYNI